MKNFIYLSAMLFGISATAQNVNIPDANFKNVLVNTPCVAAAGSITPSTDADTNNDGEIQVSEAEAIEHLIIRNSSVLSLEGIQAFANMEIFTFSDNNQITSFDISGMINLESLNCSENSNLNTIVLDNLPNLTGIDVPGNNLFEIDASETGFVEGDFSNNPNLTFINIRNGVVNDCVTLLEDSVDYTCAMFLDCPSLEIVYLDDNEMQGYHSSAPQDNVQFVTNCTAGVKENSLLNSIAYPNPVENLLTIETQGYSNISSIILYNLLGQQLASVKAISIDNISIDMTAIPTGSYLLEIISDRGKAIKKIIKQ